MWKIIICIVSQNDPQKTLFYTWEKLVDCWKLLRFVYDSFILIIYISEQVSSNHTIACWSWSTPQFKKKTKRWLGIYVDSITVTSTIFALIFQKKTSASERVFFLFAHLTLLFCSGLILWHQCARKFYSKWDSALYFLENSATTQSTSYRRPFNSYSLS